MDALVTLQRILLVREKGVLVPVECFVAFGFTASDSSSDYVHGVVSYARLVTW